VAVVEELLLRLLSLGQLKKWYGRCRIFRHVEDGISPFSSRQNLKCVLGGLVTLMKVNVARPGFAMDCCRISPISLGLGQALIVAGYS